MNNFVNNFYKNQALFYKIFLFIITAVLIVYLLPKGGKFKYEITKGKPWQYENLYAPFDFAILKSDAEIVKEKLQINTNHIPYYTVNENIVEQVKSKVSEQLEKTFTDSILIRKKRQLSTFIDKTLDDIYEYGVLLEAKPADANKLVYLKRGNEAFEVNYDKLLLQDEIRPYLNVQINLSNLASLKPELLEFFYNVIKPNVTYDAGLTQKELDSKLGSISYTR